jgi:2-oxoglutarate dehydrogenase E2 component (dihydrolipoamide succinyltransferase)
MPIDIKVPSVGESISEGTLVRWLKKEGDQVKVDEPVFELETEKASTEVPAPASGVLQIRVPAGQTVAIGSVVGNIDSSGAAPASPPPAKTSSPPPSPSRDDQKPPLSPAARRLAAEEKVEVAKVSASGRGGLILKEDVQNFLDKKPEPASPGKATPEVPTKPTPQAGKETRERMSPIRARIAERLLASQKNSASLTTFNEIDLSAVMDLRTRYKDRFKEKHDVGLGFMSFFVKASIEALKAYPLVNARIDESDIVYQHFYNIGVAVSTDKGLMVPVLRDADQMNFAGIEKAIVDLANRAKAGKVNVTDLQGGTFTITNGGIFGSMLSTPILNPPQSAILGMHAIQKRPVVRDDQIVIRPMMYVALTYDHRLIDGRDAVLFLVRIKECLEDPERMLLEI